MRPNKYIDFARMKLNQHPLLTGGVIRDLSDVRVFMEHHVYAVWDFMCLLKTLQHAIVPSTTIWTPQPHTTIGRHINEIVLGEETDIGFDGTPISHYDMYVSAMKEVGANSAPVEAFVDGLRTIGWHALNPLMEHIPRPAEKFCRNTIEVIGTQQPHKIAAAFTFGRETIIPEMFTGILKQLDNVNAPQFRFYLTRHIELDGDEHGPLALQMIDELCGNDFLKYEEVESTAVAAIESRYQFWTEVQAAIEEARA